MRKRSESPAESRDDLVLLTVKRLDRSPSFVVVPERVDAVLVLYRHEGNITYVERLREVGYYQAVGVDLTRVGDDALAFGPI